MTESSHYGGPCFEAASALPLSGGLARPRRMAGLLAALAQRPQLLVALTQLVAQTRSERVYLSDSPAGQALRDYFDQRLLGVFPQNRFCRGVLLLPDDHADYLRGRRRQALRTNLRRAARAGIQCEVVTDPSRVLAAVREVVDHRRMPITEEVLASLTGIWPTLFADPQSTLLMSCDAAGHPLAVMAAVIDDMVCLIRLAVASSHDAKWALHDHLVRVLIQRGARFLLVEGDGPFGALGFPASMRHYQHLLGYELRHLIPSRVPRSAPAVTMLRHFSHEYDMKTRRGELL